MKVAVLCGGFSPERNVSLVSGAGIALALTKKGHEVCLVDSFLGVETLPTPLFSAEPPKMPTDIGGEPNLEELKKASGNSGFIGKNVIEICRKADKVFLALHGGLGEDGGIQGFLECLGIAYTGSSHLGSAVAMDKAVTKALLQSVGIPVPKGITLDEMPENADHVILEKVGLPCIVKPACAGSSVGVTRVYEKTEIRPALEKGFAYGKILVEQLIEGRELTQPVMEGYTLSSVEILPEEGWYDYENKYNGKAREVCPAPLPTEIAEQMQRDTKKAFDVLQMKTYARGDWLLDKENKLYFLEMNSLPGMTACSLFPLSAKTAGISYEDLCDIILKG